MAAAWEDQTTGTAARVIRRNLGIRTIAQTHPLVRLESTPLMRALRAWQAEVDNPDLPRRGTPRPARTRYNDPDIDPFALPDDGLSADD